MAALEIPSFIIPSRRTPWGGDTGDGDYTVLGIDLSSASFVWTFANKPGPSGTPYFTLTNASPSAQGVSAAYYPEMVNPVNNALDGATVIRAFVTEATLEGVSWGSAPNDEPLQMYWDLLVTPTGGQQYVEAFGQCFLLPGVGD